MLRSINFLALMILSSSAAIGAGLEFRGSMLNVIEEVPDKNTGLDKIYVIYDTSGVDLVYHPAGSGQVKILSYSNLGGGYAEEVSTISEGNNIVVKDIKGNTGYIIEDGDKRYYYWIVDYLPYRFEIQSVANSPDSDCDATILEIAGNAAPIHYFTINGQQRILDREIKVEYSTQEWDNTAHEFIQKESVKYFESFTNSLRISPPSYSYTSFTISGDKFLREWNWESRAESDVISPVGIMVRSDAYQEGVTTDNSSNNATGGNTDNNGVNNDENDQNINTAPEGNSTEKPIEAGSNIISTGDGSSLGGSAPAEITFTAYGTEGVMHYEWQLTRDANFEEIEYRFNQREIDYTFNEEGTYYMRFVGSNFDGSCESIGETFVITIGASELKCPNAFSPDGDGVNDEWKVSYRSLLDFKCWIFDRFGHQIFYFEDPSLGWDGKKGGKSVAPGVYYYVIQATGSDNKKYKKSGDINILRHRNITSNNGTNSDTK